MRYLPIKDYAIIGDCRSAALISKEGSIDWLCWPRFDSPAIFSALIDRQKGGRFAVRPVGPHSVSRVYVPNTNVLETTFTTGAGVLRLVDLMPLASARDQSRLLYPEHEILRVADCIEGHVEIEVICDPRPEFGREPNLINAGALGFHFEQGRDLYALRSSFPLRPPPDRTGLEGKAMMHSGERHSFSFCSARDSPAVLPPLGRFAGTKISRTVAWWNSWLSSCRYMGPFRDAVTRSALVLKLLLFAPSGAMIAASTASLPEMIGGPANWDYRFCWLRDSAMTLRALFGLGFFREGQAFLSWLIHATRLTRPELQVMYDVYGETRMEERELADFEGYRGSRPVRIGNAAQQQLQLDIYGEVARAASEYMRHGGRFDRSMSDVLKGLGKTVIRRWKEPDQSIWEIRGEGRQHTFSKVLCWVALNELIRMRDEGRLNLSAREKSEFSDTRDKIRAAIEAHGYNQELESYVSVFETGIVDASLLILALYGYADPADRRMKKTHERIAERLKRNNLLYRYRGDYTRGTEMREGAFGICCFWEVTYLARCGEIGKAESLFSHILEFGNDVGLFAEEIDPESGDALGNFPQAFTHVGLIDAALTLHEVTLRSSADLPGSAGRKRT